MKKAFAFCERPEQKLFLKIKIAYCRRSFAATQPIQQQAANEGIIVSISV